MTTEVPLLYTTQGNLPIADLVRTEGWDFDTGGVTYWEAHHHKGELVRRQAARYHLPEGMTIKFTQGALNG